MTMKYAMKLVFPLLALCVPTVAQAAPCDRYQSDTFILNLPATITVPDSLPVGSLIHRQAFNGSAPEYFANCTVSIASWIDGRYPMGTDPVTRSYPTEAPGVGVRITMRWAGGGGPAAFSLFNQGPTPLYGKVPSFTSAEASFYKIGPVTDGTVPSGYFWSRRIAGVTQRFSLQLGSRVRFVRPAATCNLAAGDVNRTIPFAPIKVSDLRDIDYAGMLNFELTANCTNATNVTFRFSGTPAPGNNVLFANTGTASGVALWLGSRINGVQQTISPNANNIRNVAVSGNRAVLPLSAAYHKNGTVGQGTLASTATVNITYN